uniref:mRNA-capping enzyme-like n=1 Tax=Nicotiana tabacum TaxID=4097 RepID=A0A1S4CX85_TOBAC|nr:PREDICTED: mRNA-capping enzyme-like [Nicotiana tabacum]
MSCISDNQLQIGLVVDLTNTDRYYPESDWTSHDIRHVKIRCPGQDSIPDAESVDRFVSEIVQFTSQDSQASKYAVVHCTHGHNRTGYMIVHFLVRNQSVSVSEAIAIFSRARPPGIYRQKYVEALYDFYLQAKPEPLVCPQTPEWKRDADQDNDAVAPSSVSSSFEIIWRTIAALIYQKILTGSTLEQLVHYY